MYRGDYGQFDDYVVFLFGRDFFVFRGVVYSLVGDGFGYWCDFFGGMLVGVLVDWVGFVVCCVVDVLVVI